MFRFVALALGLASAAAFQAPVSVVSQSAVRAAAAPRFAVSMMADEVEDKVRLRREHQHLQRTRARTHMRRRASDWAAMRL